jgi:hypothetical protein
MTNLALLLAFRPPAGLRLRSVLDSESSGLSEVVRIALRQQSPRHGDVISWLVPRVMEL